MSIRFIHTADWQIAKVYPRFSSELAGELTAARLSAIPRIASIARAEGAAHVLVAGDVFDSDRLETVVLRRALEHMRAAEDIRWLLLPGNHDPARAGGIWERIARLSPPGNVTALTEAQPFEIARGAVVLPAPLVNRNPGRDPSAWMDDAVTAPGVTRIGLAHGSVVGFGSEGESAVGIAPDRAKRAGLAYLALGDWHGLTEIDGATWYSGTPEPDRYPDNEPGFVLSVALDGAAPARVKPIASAAFRWMKSTVAIRSIADLTPLDRQLDALADGKRQTLLRVTLQGSLALDDVSALDAWAETWAGRLRHIEIVRDKLSVTPNDGDFSRLGATGPLAAAAARLSAIANDAAHPERDDAALALLRLFAFAEAREAGA